MERTETVRIEDLSSPSSRAFTALLKGKYSYVARAWNRLFGGPESPFLHGQLLPPNSTLTHDDILTLTCDPFFYQLHESVHNATNAGTKRRAIIRAIQYASDILHRNLSPTPISLSELTPRRESSSVDVTVDYDNNDNDNSNNDDGNRQLTLNDNGSPVSLNHRQTDHKTKQQKGRNHMAWKTNTGELKQGMTIRLPGTYKELQVVSVKGGEAKLDNGERISARSEVDVLTIPAATSAESRSTSLSPAERLRAQAAARRREKDEHEEEEEEGEPADDGNDGWNVNDSDIGLEKGMLICRFGKDEELPVVRIKGGRAVIKLQSGTLAAVDCHDRKITWKWPDDVVSKIQEKEREKEKDRRKAAISSRDLIRDEREEEERGEEDERVEEREQDEKEEPEHEQEEEQRRAARLRSERERDKQRIESKHSAHTETWYKLEELSQITGHHWSKINKIRRAGELPKRSYKEEGRAIVYNEDARDYLSGVEKDRRGRRHERIEKEQEQGTRVEESNTRESLEHETEEEEEFTQRESPTRGIPPLPRPSRIGPHPEVLRRPTNLVPAGGVVSVLDIAIERASNEIEEALDKVKKLKVLIETLKEQRRQF